MDLVQARQTLLQLQEKCTGEGRRNNPSIRKNIGVLLARLRNELSLPPSNFSSLLGISVETLHRSEKGEIPLSIRTLQLLETGLESLSEKSGRHEEPMLQAMVELKVGSSDALDFLIKMKVAGGIPLRKDSYIALLRDFLLTEDNN